MRNDAFEIGFANSATRTRRVWYGHGSSRLVTENAHELPPADVIDEAMANYERVEPAEKTAPAANAPGDLRLLKNSLVTDLSAQLEALDRQRDHLAQLLRNIDTAAFPK